MHIFSFILFYRITYDRFCSIEDHNVRQIGFHVCVKMRCKRKKLSGQPNTL